MRLLLLSLGDPDDLGLRQGHQCNFLSTFHQGWTEINQPTNQSIKSPSPPLAARSGSDVLWASFCAENLVSIRVSGA